MPPIRQLSVEELPASPTVLDVREDDEWAAGHIDGAIHIPLGELTGRLPELPDADPLVVTCRGGGRSARATAYLQQIGIDAANLDGGMQAWSAAGRSMVSESGAPPTVI
ncbi:MAG: rhodanese-like domain-containing protein [Geodermatophilaceae bacterium]|jgi:rhodanese-related sulfurtransferase|nr:rhodanese-like domain-containing protein [Geodermatophilaceae bacterium]